MLGALASGLAGLTGSGPSVARSGPAFSGRNTVIVPSDRLNVGAIVNALSGSERTGGLPIEMGNGLARPLHASIGLGQNKASFSAGPLLLLGGAGLIAYLALK